MAGVCILCNNLEEKSIIFNGALMEGCRCSKGHYDENEMPGYFSRLSLMKQTKFVRDIQDKCDDWDDRLKGKNSYH
jgi:hypothetical protein